MLTFLPELKTVREFRERRDLDKLNSTRVAKTNEILALNPGFPVRTVAKYSEAKGKDVFRREQWALMTCC